MNTMQVNGIGKQQAAVDSAVANDANNQQKAVDATVANVGKQQAAVDKAVGNDVANQVSKHSEQRPCPVAAPFGEDAPDSDVLYILVLPVRSHCVLHRQCCTIPNGQHVAISICHPCLALCMGIVNFVKMCLHSS